ncbi:MAG: hypothetical protein ACTS73_02720 [Arsenophonus sp. NEOnobi-MAG3]
MLRLNCLRSYRGDCSGNGNMFQELVATALSEAYKKCRSVFASMTVIAVRHLFSGDFHEALWAGS